MNKWLKRYWFETEEGPGIGVTAYSIEDAKSLIMAEESAMFYRPVFDSYIEDIDIQKLDQNHVMVVFNNLCQG